MFGVLLRGAVSVGEYVRSDNSILGPAVKEVADWYEKSEWMGVVATPSCENVINKLEKCLENPNYVYELFGKPRKPGEILNVENLEPALWPFFVKYKVELKSCYKTLFALSWPLKFIEQYSHLHTGWKKYYGEKQNPSKLLCSLMKKCQSNEEGVEKRKNTREFFEWYYDMYRNDWRKDKRNK